MRYLTIADVFSDNGDLHHIGRSILRQVDSADGEAIAGANAPLPPTSDYRHRKAGELVFALLTYPALRERHHKIAKFISKLLTPHVLASIT